MRPLSKPVFVLLPAAVILLAMLGACSSEDDAQNTATPTGPSTAEALAGYWQAQDQASAALLETNELWEDFAALAADPATEAAVALDAAAAYATAGAIAAERLTAWRELEQQLAAAAGKAQFTDEAHATALAVLAGAAEAALTGGEGLMVAWQVLGGLLGLREALADPDGTIPVAGLLADWLEARLESRDTAVVAAILDDQDHGGLLPLSDLSGATPAERAAAYADLDDNHALKRQCRAAVPRWDIDERSVSLDLLERAARGHLRLFSGVGAGGSALAGLPDHLTGAHESDPLVHNLTLNLRRAGSLEPITGQAVVLLHRRGQPEAMPRLALLSGVAAQALVDLPAGDYDLLALADGWARAIASEVSTGDGPVITLDLSHLQENPLVLEGIEAPAMGGAGARLDLQAIATSTLDDPLAFTWQVSGGPVTDLMPQGSRCSFRPAEAGTYTVSVRVSDGRGHTASDSTSIEVTPFAVSVFRTDFLHEQIADNRLNPGEVDTLQLWVANRGAEDITGTARLTGRDGLATDVSSGTWTLAAGRQTRWKVPVAIPADWDRPRAAFDFAFTVDGVTLVQELDYRVDFYASLDFIGSPVTSRILTISGLVANPSLETAQLILDRDRRHIYELPLQAGHFEQVVILPGSAETRRVRLEVVAESGLRTASARAGFMATITRAEFRTTLFWNTAGTDVDLWVTDPLGERCYFGNRNTASGLRLDVDDVNGYGPENITGENDLPAGEYLVQVHYWSDHGTNLASDCTVMITLREGTPHELVEVFTETLTDGQVWNVATVTWDGEQASLALPPGGAKFTVVPGDLMGK